MKCVINVLGGEARMIGNKKVYAIILARQGSTRLKNKCDHEINGKTLIEIAIEKCRKSKYIDQIFLSTDSMEYQEKYKNACEIIDRPSSLSNGSVPNLPVYKHAIDIIPNMEEDDLLCHVDLCIPLSRTEQIDFVIEHLHNENLDSCFSCKEIKNSIVGNKAVVSQDLPFQAMQFNLCRCFTKKTIEQAKLGTWGTGKMHEYLGYWK